MSITARMWAGARDAAGRDELVLTETSMTLAQVTQAVVAQAPDSRRAVDVLAACSILVGDQPVSSQDPHSVVVSDSQTVEYLPPFAGG